MVLRMEHSMHVELGGLLAEIREVRQSSLSVGSVFRADGLGGRTGLLGVSPILRHRRLPPGDGIRGRLVRKHRIER